MSATDSEFLSLKSDVAELRERIERIERFISDNILTRIVVLERLKREKDPCDDPDAEMLDDHARRGAHDDETD